MKTKDDHFMHMAIALANEGKTPFGCVIVNDEQVLSQAFNTVKADYDVTAHAEINAIRKLPAAFFGNSSSLILYTTCEPCIMCMGAIVFAGIGRLVFGASIEEISKFKHQIHVSSVEIAERSNADIKVKGGVLHKKCLALLKK
jgi:tRNA(adenine34) deaminase